MPKRTREDFLSIHKLSAAIDNLAAEATPWQVACRCASAMADALQAHAIVIHHHDLLRREVRSIGVHGPNAGDVLGTTTNVDDDHVVTAVLANRKPLMLRLDGALPRFVPDRHRLLGTSRSLAAFPVVRADACVGIIEIVGVADERRQGIADACELVAERLVGAFDSLENRPSASTDAAPAASERPVSYTWARVERSPDAGARFLVTSSKREHRIVNAAPATFPKRAPTLMCHAKR